MFLETKINFSQAKLKNKGHRQEYLYCKNKFNNSCISENEGIKTHSKCNWYREVEIS